MAGTEANENGLHVPVFLDYANGTATTTSSHGEQLKFGLMKMNGRNNFRLVRLNISHDGYLYKF